MHRLSSNILHNVFILSLKYLNLNLEFVAANFDKYKLPLVVEFPWTKEMDG